MRGTLKLTFCILGALCVGAVHGQKIKVSDPKLELRDNKILITYDILNSTPSDEFIVELVVKDSEGNRINAAALSGDIGEMVMGGDGKQISWDLEVDHIEMNADIYVRVYVKAVPPPQPVVVAPVKEEDGEQEPEPQEAESRQEDQADGQTEQDPEQKEPEPQQTEKDSPATKEEEQPTLKSTEFNRTGLILQSLALPGLGLSRYKGGPHWIRGALGYGCIAGSITFNRAAINTYDGIIDLSDFQEKNELYEKSLRQDQVSEVLAYTAVAIWVSDLVWTFVGTRDLDWGFAHQRGFRINPTLDPVSLAPMLCLNIKF